MYIQLTRTDGLPIWLNASFIVTVEPARSGGSIVVPIGDGLDYDVKEAPETVLALLNEAPPAKVVPVPPPRALTRTPDDLSPDIRPRTAEEEANGETEDAPRPSGAEQAKPSAKRRTRRTKTVADKKVDPEKKAAKSDDAQPPPAAAPMQSAPIQDEAALPQDFDKIVADLKARKCRTAKRMRNAIKSYFGKKDDTEIDRLIEAMLNRGLLLIGPDGHVDWTA